MWYRDTYPSAIGYELNEAHTPYHLRPRRHDRQLIPKINKLYDSNFIQRMLYKDLYWLIDWQLINNSLLWFMYSVVFYITSLVLSCVLSTILHRIVLYVKWLLLRRTPTSWGNNWLRCEKSIEVGAPTDSPTLFIALTAQVWIRTYRRDSAVQARYAVQGRSRPLTLVGAYRSKVRMWLPISE